MKNYYQDFDNIMTYYQEALKYALDNADCFVNKKSTKITYSIHLVQNGFSMNNEY